MLGKLKQKEEELEAREKSLNAREADLAMKEAKLAKGIAVAPAKTNAPAKVDFKQIKRVRLDVGGKQISTSLSTLKSDPNSLLATLVSTPSTESDGVYLIDRNPAYFEYILDWLRDGKDPRLAPGHSWMRLLEEAEYWNLSNFPKGPYEDPDAFPFACTIVSTFNLSEQDYIFLKYEEKMYRVALSEFYRVSRMVPVAFYEADRKVGAYVQASKFWCFEVKGGYFLGEVLANGFRRVDEYYLSSATI